MTPDPSTNPDRSRNGFSKFAQLTVARRVTVILVLGAVLTLMIGAGFSNMSASSAPTALETAVIRWIVVLCLVGAGVAYLVDRRSRGAEQNR